jgi:ATP-binding cassette subfamily C protein LapB
LFLDEPTAHFDVKSESEFLERLKELAQRDMTIVISTHRMSLLSFVDRLLVFDRGRLMADGPRDNVLAMLQGGKAQQGQAPRAGGVEPIHGNVVSSVGRSNAAN